MIPLEDEVWAPIEEFPLYSVSSHGRVVRHVERSTSDNFDRLRKLDTLTNGTVTAVLFTGEGNVARRRQVNKLVASTFDAPMTEDAEWNTELKEWQVFGESLAVWHRDGDLQNCRIDNLMWEGRGRVIEWNRMHREGRGRLKSPKVLDRESGNVYDSLYHAAIAVGITESKMCWWVETYGEAMRDQARFVYHYTTKQHAY